VKKLVVLAALAGGVAFVVKRNQKAKAEADLWREATAPASSPLGGASVNGNGPANTTTSDAARNN